jgi:hypothetical protein
MLRQSLEALAAPGKVALARVPAGTVKADELAIDYDNFFRAFVGNFGAELSTSQREALSHVEQLLDAMSGQKNSELWTDEAVCSHAAWAEVRAAALSALQELGWGAP